jgi:hypothetical protein
MSDYHVIDSRSLEDDDDGSEGLNTLVNKYLAAGYVTVGGVATTTLDSMYLQAVMRPAAARGGRRSLRKSGKSRKTQRRSRR